MTDYPPAPWALRGQLYLSVLRMPPGTVPAEICPAWLRPDRAMTLATAFVDYQPGGQLSYREFLVTSTNATLTGGTILRIWVDSPASLAGGRALWFIPKELGEFTASHGARREPSTISMSLDGQPVAALRFTPKLTLPGRWWLPNYVTQEHQGAIRRTKSVFRPHLQLGSGELEIPEHSPVSFLRHGKVLGHLAMRDFTVRFGLRSKLTNAERHPSAPGSR